MPNNRITKIVVVGGGISGVTSAYEFAKTLKLPKKNITILEKEPKLGGEIKNFSHPNYPNLVTPLGAGVIAHNYPILDVIKEKKILLETILPTRKDTVKTVREISQRSLGGKFTYVADFLWQNVKFAKHVWQFNRACTNKSPHPPKDQHLTFEAFAEKYKLGKIKTYMSFLCPGFGYGMFDDKDCYAYRMFAYMGFTTILGICTSYGLVSVKGGYQTVVERMAEGFDVQAAVNITKIVRNERGVEVTYKQDGETKVINADALVLAIPPQHYPELGMDLSPAEQACANQVSSRPYATVAVRLKDIPPEQVFFPEAYSRQGFRHPSFLYTVDNRTQLDDDGGRLCTIYINLDRDDVDFSLEEGSEGHKFLIEDLRDYLGTQEIKIDSIQKWPHYNPSVPWEAGVALQKEEVSNDLHTLHVGAFLPGSFETVGATSGYAIKAVNQWLENKTSMLGEAWNNIKRSFYFFTVPKAKPIDETMLDERPLDQPLVCR